MAVWTVLVLLALQSAVLYHVHADSVFDFEDISELSFFEWSKNSTVVISDKRYKHGVKSLKWTWGPSDVLNVNLTSKNIVGQSVTKGGVKLWIYNEISMPRKCLTVKVIQVSTPTCRKRNLKTHTSSFHVSLAFTGWRAAWVGYREFRDCPSKAPKAGQKCYKKQITMLKIYAPSIEETNSVFIDLLRWVNKIKYQSRDAIVPIITSQCLNCSTLNSGVTEQDALSVYRRSNFWQQTYRWSIVTVPTPPSLGKTELSSKLSELHLIKKRLRNWYADETTSFIQLEIPQGSTYPQNVVRNNFYLEKRWMDLMDNIDDAYVKFRALQLTESSDATRIITGSPLFCKFSEYGNSKETGEDRKFGHVMRKVLLPLALEYYLKSRSLEVSNTVCQWAKTYGQSDSQFSEVNVKAVVGADTQMKQTFNQTYQNHTGSEDPPTDCAGADRHSYSKIKHAIAQLNIKRKENILLLFKYLKDQGWAQGSAVGSTSHEINRSGAGFAHALFLFQKELEASGQLEAHLKTLKYYSDFSESYQTVFEFQGTTADRMRTISLYRLMAVLMMPEEASTVNPRPKALAKVRDMESFRRWYNNIISINKGLAGVIKPDYTSFHHHTFYGSAYVPPALHNAALIHYLINGTSFGNLSNQSDLQGRDNVRKALEILKVVSVKYSTPNGIGGRFPGYSNGIIGRTVPAFAYFAVSAPMMQNGNNTKLGDLGGLDIVQTKTFLRLYDIGNETDCGDDVSRDDGNTRPVKQYLCLGRVRNSISYLNTLGSLQIMQKIKEKADKQKIKGEDSPQGHWAKNFGAMSIHRRDDWAVTMKGFSRYVWNTESSDRENVFGVYQSNGALQIANSEDQLKHHDIDNGWDWTKVPGTTTIGFDILDLKIGDDRLFNPLRLTGGVTFSGRNPYDTNTLNGVFGMMLSQPPFKLPTNSPLQNVAFQFRKSVFFHDDFLVCVGSRITTSGVTGDRKTYTTLFQDKIVFTPVSPTSSSQVYKCGHGDAKTASSWGRVKSVVLEDAKGNRYFVPKPRSQKLHFNPSTIQTSYSKKGSKKMTTGTYCTAWFDHAVNGNNKKYKYTVLVKGAASTSPALSSSDFTIIQENAKAHVVKISRGIRSSVGPMFGYVIFGNNVVLSSKATEGLHAANGPIKSSSGHPCLITAQIVNGTTLAISLSNPDLNLRRDRDAPSWCPKDQPAVPTRNSDVTEEHKYCAASASEQVTVSVKNNILKVSRIYVNGEAKKYPDMNDNEYITLNGATVKFKMLQNGFTTEVHLTPSSDSR